MPDHAHVLEIKSLVARFATYAGLAYDHDNQLKAAFRTNDGKNAMLLDADQVRHTALVLASLKSPAPGFTYGNPQAPSFFAGTLPVNERDMMIDATMDHYIRAFDQLAHAEEALDKGYLKFKDRPEVKNKNIIAAPLALNEVPNDLRMAGFATFFPQHSRAAALFKPISTKQSYTFTVYGQPIITVNMLTGQQLEPSLNKHAPVADVLVFVARTPPPAMRPVYVGDQQVAGHQASVQPQQQNYPGPQPR